MRCGNNKLRGHTNGRRLLLVSRSENYLPWGVRLFGLRCVGVCWRVFVCVWPYVYVYVIVGTCRRLEAPEWQAEHSLHI